MGKMAHKVIQTKKPRQDPRQRLLSLKSASAIMKGWTPKMREVADVINQLPPQAGTDPMLEWGFVFAIDALRDNAPAIQALFEAMDELTWEVIKVRPTREELFQMADRLLAFKVEVRTKLKNHVTPANHVALGPRTSGKVGFVRRRN